METAAIRYRVSDFLKKQPPFHVMDEADLLELAGQGRVRFFEPNQYILSQGASRFDVHVIQQGTVSLWDERGAEPRLLDIRGAGDMLGIDQLRETRVYPYSATASSDVLIYSFPTDDFRFLVEKYPNAAHFVSAYGDLTTLEHVAIEQAEPHKIVLRELVAGHKPHTCDPQTRIRDAARTMQSSGAHVVVVQDEEHRVHGIVSRAALLEWIAAGNGSTEQTVASLLRRSPVTVGPDASLADGVLAMNSSMDDALAITSDGTLEGSLEAVVTTRDFGPSFGDRPVEILHEIASATDVRTLRDLNQRARTLTLRYLQSPAATDWLSRFTSAIDIGIAKRVIAMAAPQSVKECWCFCGRAGRAEGLPRIAPEIVLISSDARAAEDLERVREWIEACGYLPAVARTFERAFYAASADEWTSRYLGWVNDPISKEIYLARFFFDLRPVFGANAIWSTLETTVTRAITPEFMYVVANDCLLTLPPLTFFRNAVLDETGEQTEVFRLDETALRPLVDVGRVFGLATRAVFSRSTLERFTFAQEGLPDHASIFREASEALRIVLLQQGRVGIREGTAGRELPPALLAPYDRQLLRGAFRSILRLIEFTGDLSWLKAL